MSHFFKCLMMVAFLNGSVQIWSIDTSHDYGEHAAWGGNGGWWGGGNNAWYSENDNWPHDLYDQRYTDHHPYQNRHRCCRTYHPNFTIPEETIPGGALYLDLEPSGN